MGKMTFKIDVVSLLIGMTLGAMITVLVFLAMQVHKTEDYTSKNDSNVSSAPLSTSSAETTEVSYQTGIKEFVVNTESGETVTLHTPEYLYSLSDQYLEAMVSYYGESEAYDNMITLGDSTNIVSSNTLISICPMSSTKKILETVYPDVSEEELDSMLKSAAYVYMTTGEINEDTDLDIEEIASEVYGDVTWKFFKIDYDAEYYTDESQTETISVHQTELAVYSDTDDSIEIVCYSADGALDVSQGVELIRELLR